MNNLNWRAVSAIGVLIVAVVIVANVAFSFMWAHGTPSGPYGNPSYGPGTMMGPWMWGGMGFFWIFPIAGFLFLLLLFGIISRMFVTSLGESQPRNVRTWPASGVAHPSEACRNCGHALEASWMACPYCGTARPTLAP